MAVTATVLGKELFCKPPMSVQNEFAAFIEELDKSKVVVQNGREHLKKLFAEVYCNEEL